MKPLTKKIVGGKYKGKLLKLPSKTTTRSSKGIVLESYFNTLQFEIMDSVLVELFSGSGSIGLEALSRGAKRIIFMERDRDALKVLRSNIAQTDPAACEVIAGDTFETIAQTMARLKQLSAPAYFFIDPPFSIREGHEDIYDKMLGLIAKLPRESVKLITIEHMSGLELPDAIGSYSLQKRKKFGKTSLSYYL
ncbi:16S rRNA (guanine(966)-N(2))-methyltransferase RsmD [Sulfurimonas sp. HSL-3221]|uniref:16S rRNA (guanine(966)-N(2))-methyltransferase RsmD n=1 Tax=Sulfurimonadaceae TaxID=2771471 RepID=UPI001E478A2A|nr:16S rRNA (guanine(966)-N(2))-methyltransferase RsmD [Sulfurimonas sp. HSL-3221]UFS62037.1 16S rRNA (guanine(966)-N(2))-methyltransferase RsmD [Sulfurimonas sp. HSL-3221]